MRLLITGTRNGFPGLEARLRKYLIANRANIEHVHLGDARGVDAQALSVCRELGIPYTVHRAKWRGLLKRAGHERNGRMVAACGPGDLCLAFPDADSVGTYDCAKQAATAGLRVAWWKREKVTHA